MPPATTSPVAASCRRCDRTSGSDGSTDVVAISRDPAVRALGRTWKTGEETRKRGTTREQLDQRGNGRTRRMNATIRRCEMPRRHPRCGVHPCQKAVGLRILQHKRSDAVVAVPREQLVDGPPTEPAITVEEQHGLFHCSFPTRGSLASRRPVVLARARRPVDHVRKPRSQLSTVSGGRKAMYATKTTYEKKPTRTA